MQALDAYVSLGSNLGERQENLCTALAKLEIYGGGLRVARRSAVYLTEPQGEKDQEWFANQVVGLEIDPVIWSPEGVMSTLLAIEAQLGRERGEPGGPRVIDLDLLLWDDLVMQSDFLTLPHPRMLKRAFVLVPLREIAPDLVLPGAGSVEQCLAALDYRVEGQRIWQD
ncbi:MAG: 2-amino-4-hydroxy-6-hydroxymethyldihydropteridine diphosphokinase [Desulfovibrionaceae bacterium]|nr:2-amino-4-hydroxy-6-hydroxymethyldihydropteridine diphosphokinase [Desulfovibrionaceae bacterium]